MHLSYNPELGYACLQALVQGIERRKGPVWELKVLRLHDCGLGGAGECPFVLSDW